jgi:hypothetical protein
VSPAGKRILVPRKSVISNFVSAEANEKEGVK